MKRKEFIAWNAALLGSLVLPFKGRAAGPMEAVGAAAEAGDEDALWETVRRQFILDPSWMYLNFAGLGACPLPVLNSLVEWNQAEERLPDVDHERPDWNKAKAKMARLLGKTCRTEDLAFVGCATEGIGIIVNGLTLKAGDEVITSTHEHVAVNASLINRKQKDGIVIRTFEPDLENGLGNVDRIAKLINGRTKLILVSHVTCTTGQRFPEKEIAALARERGVLFALDGAQAVVNVPFDIVDCGVDFYTASTHKWCMAPKRTGFLYIRQGLLEVLRPQTVGMSTNKRTDIWTQEMEFQPNPERYEFGTENDALFHALGTACDFVQAIEPERVSARGRALAERFYEGLKDIPGIERLSPAEEAYRSCIITFRMKNHPYEEVYDYLRKEKILARRIQEGKLWAVRVSFFLNNRMEDVTKTLELVDKLART